MGVLGMLGFLACRPLPPPSSAPVATPAATPAPAPTSGQPSADSRKHVAFAEQFAAFEKNQVNASWRCLFGKDGDLRRFSSAEQLSLALESALFADPRSFPGHVSENCVAKALRAAKEAPGLVPEPPADYQQALDEYGKALTELAGALSLWAERAPQRIETKRIEQRVNQAGETWSTIANPNNPDPAAWSYDVFLRCAVPELDTLKDSQQLLEHLAAKCIQKRDQPLDAEFFSRLQKTCIPGAQTAPAKAPPKFKLTFNKLAADYDRLSQAFGACFRKMNKSVRAEDLESVGKAWERTISAGSRIREITASKINPAGSGAP